MNSLDYGYYDKDYSLWLTIVLLGNLDTNVRRQPNPAQRQYQ